IFPPDDFPLLFYREPKAPDLELEPDDVDLDEVRAVELFWTTGTGLSQEPSRSTTLAALAARPDGAITVHDLDYRQMFWGSRDDAAGRARPRRRGAGGGEAGRRARGRGRGARGGGPRRGRGRQGRVRGAGGGADGSRVTGVYRGAQQKEHRPEEHPPERGRPY